MAMVQAQKDGTLTGTSYELRPADVLRTMNPLPQVNADIQFTLKDDGRIDQIMCFARPAGEIVETVGSGE